MPSDFAPFPIPLDRVTSGALADVLAGLRVGFLYNHDDVHQVAHTAPIISPLRKIAPTLQIDVLASDERQLAAVAEHLEASASPPGFVRLQSSALAAFMEKALGGLVPLRRIGRLSTSRDILARYDALVVPETTSTVLKTKYGLKARLIFLPHGAGDRSVSMTPEIAHFDYVLLPGEKTRDRMLAQGIIQADHCAIVGYPKFDAVAHAAPQKLFGNDRPVVLYNPHFEPRLSSWFEMGSEVLEYFAAQDRFNLIVAPHVMLFRRRLLASAEHRMVRFRRDIPARFLNLPNIHVDCGSARSVDMTYTNAADIYLGDVSSQIYEFIRRPRPAIFLNSHGANWQGDPNYDCWKFGPVVQSVAEMAGALETAVPLRADFAMAQEDGFCRSFSADPMRRSPERAALAIAQYLGRQLG